MSSLPRYFVNDEGLRTLHKTSVSGLQIPIREVLIVTHESSQTNKTRHFGRDAEIQAMDGNQPVLQVPDAKRTYHPFFHALGDRVHLFARSQAPAWECGF